MSRLVVEDDLVPERLLAVDDDRQRIVLDLDELGRVARELAGLGDDDRDGLAAHLREAGIPTAQYYPKPLHQQTAYREFPVGAGGMKVTDDIAKRVISLPMHAYLDEPTQARIADAIGVFVKAGG